MKNFRVQSFLVSAAIICCCKIHESTLKTSRSSNSRKESCSETFDLQTLMELTGKISSLLRGVHHFQVLLARTITFGTEGFVRYSWHFHYSKVLMYSFLNLLHIYYSLTLAKITKLYPNFFLIAFPNCFQMILRKM